MTKKMEAHLNEPRRLRYAHFSKSSSHKRQYFHVSWLFSLLRRLSDRIKRAPEMIFCDSCDCFHMSNAPHIIEWLDYQELDVFQHISLFEGKKKFDYYKEKQ